MKEIFRAERQLWTNKISIHYGHQQENGLWVAQDVVLNRVSEAAVTCPMMQISIDAAQMLMDELWNCGLRPSEGTGSAGSLAATEKHLSDMQTIAFGLLYKHGVRK